MNSANSIKAASKSKRLFRVLGMVFILLIITLYIGLPMVMALLVIRPDSDSGAEAPEYFNEVELLTVDDVRLKAWYAEPQNGAVIILVHGAGSGRESVRSYAEMLYQNGFGVLAVSMRGYGDSAGSINRLGWNGNQDIGAALDFLSGRAEVEVIGGLGLSMGGEILLGAASTYPIIRAIAADGATHRALNEYIALPENRSLYRNFSQRVFTLMVRLFSGDQPPDPPLLESIQAADNSAFLFIAAGNDADEVAYNRLFHETATYHSDLWVIPEIEHTGGMSHNPRDYETRVINFFTEVLLAGSN